MSRKIALIVSMLLFVVGCDKMGSRGPAVRAQSDDEVPESAVVHYFINQNPDYSDSLAGVSEDPVWVAEIIEIDADSTATVSTPDGYEATDTAEIHSLGLLTPSENLHAAIGQNHSDWHSNFWANRKWGSWINVGYRTSKLKFATCGTGTYRYTIPGWCLIRCRTKCNSEVWWDHWWWDGADRTWGYAEQQTWTYPAENTYWSWDQEGWHSWGSGSNGWSHLTVPW